MLERWGISDGRFWMSMGGFGHFADEKARPARVFPDPPDPAERYPRPKLLGLSPKLRMPIWNFWCTFFDECFVETRPKRSVVFLDKKFTARKTDLI